MTKSARFLIALAFLLPAARAALATEGEASTLEGRLAPLIKAHKGKVAVAVKNLETGEAFVHHADDPMPTASLIKFPVMIETYRQAEAGRVDLDRTMVTLRADDKVPGSGILTPHFSAGATFPLIDAVHLMIVFSDNTATNLVLDQIGLKSTGETMEKLGCPNTKLNSKVFRGKTSIAPERSRRFGLGSTTASEMIRLLELLHKKELVSRDASEAMYKQMLACEDPYKFRRFAPPGMKIAMKTGDLDAAKVAAGIIECERGAVAVCVLTSENEDRRWITDNAGNRLCAEVARAVIQHFSAAPRESSKTADHP